MAHEFWIDPVDFTVASGDRVEANIRVGEEFRGNPLSFLPRNFLRFETIQNGGVRPVEGRLGDIPAMAVDSADDGLLIVVHETTENRLTYREWERFLRFASHKDFADIEARHDARGLPREEFVESYARYAKSLIAVGDGEGSDREIGLRTEIVALANPYTDDLSGGLPVLVLLDGEPRIDAQVELFDRDPTGEVVVTLHRTDEEGVALLPVEAGHAYLADAVVLEPVEPAGPRDPVWRSLWASLTFAVP